jgi:hypothetical protein
MRLAIQDLVVLAGLGRLHNKSALWVVTLRKIILVGETSPQNCSFSGNRRKHEVQMKEK